MRSKFCDNELCDNPSAKDVRVSVNRPSDQVRSLCSTCEEAFSIGVQHGTMVAGAKTAMGHLDRFLKKDGFAILTFNEGDPSAHGPFEAWAYQGPLDLQVAAPITFGVGPSIPEAIIALEYQLKGLRAETVPCDRRERSLRHHES